MIYHVAPPGAEPFFCDEHHLSQWFRTARGVCKSPVVTALWYVGRVGENYVYEEPSGTKYTLRGSDNAGRYVQVCETPAPTRLANIIIATDDRPSDLVVQVPIGVGLTDLLDSWVQIDQVYVQTGDDTGWYPLATWLEQNGVVPVNVEVVIL